MKALVIGSGAREHAFSWGLRQSSKLTELFCAPGNPGISKVAKILPIPVDKIDDLLAFAKENKIDLTVVGPEYPLSLGIVDAFRDAGLRIFGPIKAAAAIEGSKSFAKDIMTSAKVPTARHETFLDEKRARSYCQSNGAPIVLKADGLAAGKGVCVCTENDQIETALNFIFGELGADKVVIEDFLEGVEASFIVAVSESHIVPMASSHDYKRLLDNQRGPNTGGMGSVSPTSHLTVAQEEWTVENIIKPTLNELKRRNIPFTGFLYAGLMISPKGDISVVEFNARMGDPECQSIMRRFKGDFFELLFALSSDYSNSGSNIPLPPVSWSKETAVTIVASSYGYPSEVRKGDEIFGLEQAAQLSDIVVFHGGTSVNSTGSLVTAGGRVLSVTSLGQGVEDARHKAYRAADMVQYNGMHVRRDIAQ